MRDSDFPREEYVSRCENTRLVMKANNIDALILTESENICYFSGFRRSATTRGGYFLILPLETPPILVIRKIFQPDAEATTWVEDIRPWGGAKRFELPANLIQYVCTILKESKLDNNTIGMELGKGMRVDATQVEIESLRTKLSKAKIVDVSEIIWQMRQVKSSAEVDCIRGACDITVKAMEEGLKAVKPGVSERELLRIIYMRMLELGAEDIPLNLYMHVFGGRISYGLGDPRSTNRKMERGDIVIFDGGACERGYFSDITRLACIGNPTQAQRIMFDVGMKANNAAVAEIRPAQKINDVFDAAATILRNEGLEKCNPDDDVGHSIGLEVHEPPYLGAPYGDVTLKPNMVFAVETWLYDEPLLHGKAGDVQIGVEDNVLVTPAGHEILTPLEPKLWII